MKNDQENKTFTFSTIQISLIGVLMGLGLVLSRVAIPLGTTNRLSLGFVVTAVISMLFGPWVGGFAALGVDLLTSFIFGQQGVFFIGFTLTAFVNGVIYGVFLHRRRPNWKHVLLAVLFQTVISNIILNTLWIYILFPSTLKGLLIARIPQNLLMGPIRFVLLYIITQNKQLLRVFDRYTTAKK